MLPPTISIVTSCYKGLPYLASFLKNLSCQSIFQQCELILVHNEPHPEEIAIIQQYHSKYPDQLKHILVKPVELLAASWNRGWKASSGEFVAIWNVDDLRENSSLERQLSMLRRFPGAAMTYGDFIETKEYGVKTGTWYSTPAFTRKAFAREILSGGAFLLFRKAACSSAGPFDEQFKCCVDFEYTIRLVLSGKTFIRTDGLIGYFTNEHRGLSSEKGDVLRQTEDTVLQLRYGIFDRIKSEWLKPARAYRIDKILQGDRWIEVSQYLENYSDFIKNRKSLWWVGRGKNFIRHILVLLGIWDYCVVSKMRLSGKIHDHVE